MATQEIAVAADLTAALSSSCFCSCKTAAVAAADMEKAERSALTATCFYS